MPSAPQPTDNAPSRNRRGSILLTLGKIFLGSALLLAVLGLTILDNDPPVASHEAGGEAAAASAVPALSPDDTITPTPYQQATSVGGYLAVSAVVDDLKIYDHVPPGSTLKLTFPRTGTNQVTSTFLAIGETTDPTGYTWYQIRLPARPNGSTGWVRANDMVPAPLTHAVRVDLSDHRIDLYELGTKVRSYPVGVGRMKTPTALGEFYVTLKVRPVRKVYGDLIIMISAFSEQLPDWPGGGQAGIHGTNDDSSIGKDVSAGCIRMHNKDILELSESMPLGTPVFVQE